MRTLDVMMPWGVLRIHMTDEAWTLYEQMLSREREQVKIAPVCVVKFT